MTGKIIGAVLAAAAILIAFTLHEVGILKLPLPTQANQANTTTPSDDQEIVIKISKGRGNTTFQLGTLIFDKPMKVRFKPVIVKADGKAVFSLSGIVELQGPRHYSIPMPCFYQMGDAQCVRIMMIIPGYDGPILIQPGDYQAKLSIGWESTGEATVTLKLVVVPEEEPEPVPETP
ncbi:hypothetical protein MA03_03370 [Infirmifilum uzonense]|uniref:Uncharacterized protein n=1 Tax=Infirmifilum uzonense TaxID=1550241 RepID=A0A0F7FH36_9CREN|nr:hypothetical protein [Infirmifilum uzonense]AKG38514.1 hypothetical protein MA03_03370 [Infirmifilum uzonense]